MYKKTSWLFLDYNILCLPDEGTFSSGIEERVDIVIDYQLLWRKKKKKKDKLSLAVIAFIQAFAMTSPRFDQVRL